MTANKFFTSDHHFGHARIIEHCNRPFATVEEMDAELIKRWNSVVGPTDEVFHLGDFAFKSPKLVRPKLNGRINLVIGNHDSSTNYGFAWMKPYYELKVNGQEIVLFHYGMRTWHHDLRGTWHLYGHSHGGLPAYGKSFDVGVDCHNFYPLSYDEVKRKMDKKEVADHPRF